MSQSYCYRLIKYIPHYGFIDSFQIFVKIRNLQNKPSKKNPNKLPIVNLQLQIMSYLRLFSWLKVVSGRIIFPVTATPTSLDHFESIQASFHLFTWHGGWIADCHPQCKHTVFVSIYWLNCAIVTDLANCTTFYLIPNFSTF